MSLEALLRAAAVPDRKNKIPALADEMLREAVERYRAARQLCPFSPGTLVTPRKDATYSGAGERHVVAELAPSPFPNFLVSTPGNTVFGQAVDMRILCFQGDNITAYWVESWQFEPWEAAPANLEQL